MTDQYGTPPDPDNPNGGDNPDDVTARDTHTQADATIAATLTADEREYVPVPDDEKPHPSTLMHVENVPDANAPNDNAPDENE